MNEDEYEDPEIMTAVIKYMKRQIKRAYPECFDVLVSESISVVRHSHGRVDLAESKIKGVDNFFIGSSQIGSGEGLQAKISAAHRVYDEFFSN
ncbi:MAG: hypothetical protein R2827_01230 [Bdellovibrionales bacterium]